MYSSQFQMGGGGYPSQTQTGEYLSQVKMGVPRPGPDGGYHSQVQTGGNPARLRWGSTPARSRGGVVSFRPDRTEDGVLDTWRAVCLLRSRRRTFLYSGGLRENICRHKLKDIQFFQINTVQYFILEKYYATLNITLMFTDFATTTCNDRNLSISGTELTKN